MKGYGREKGWFWFSGFSAGIYNLWINAPGLAPIMLKDLELGTGNFSYGKVEVSKGTVVNLKLLLAEGVRTAMSKLSFESIDGDPEFHYRRIIDVVTEPYIAGLRKGRFKITYRHFDSNNKMKEWNKEIEVDGKTPVTFEVDFR